MAAITPFVEAANEEQELEPGEGTQELAGLGTFAVERKDGGHDFYESCGEAMEAAGGLPVLNTDSGRRVKRCPAPKDPYLGAARGRKKSVEPTAKELAFAVEEARQLASKSMREARAGNKEEARRLWKEAAKELRQVGLEWTDGEFDVPESLRYSMTEVQQVMEAVHHVITGAETASDVFGKLGSFGAVGVKNLVEQAHAGLTRFVWNRQLIEDHLRTCRFWVEDAKDGFVIKIDKRLPRDTMPWKVMSSGARGDTFMLFSEGNSKMATLSWDLPAGPPGLGGTCPGAVAGQTILPPAARAAQLDASRRFLKILPPGATEPLPFHEERTICGFCYASEGNFGYTEIQAAMLVRYWWTREALASPANRTAWIATMAEGVLRSPFELQECQYSGRTSRPVRVHSSGDFFSPAYAEAWMEVANLVGRADPSFLFWAPTRTWASGFPWERILAKNTEHNFVVRPSAYHVGDAAPGPLAPGNAKGSTSLVMPPVSGKSPSNFQRLFPDALQDGQPGESSRDPRRDFDCPAYLGDAEGSCVSARCRVCWTKGDWSVNYPFH